MDTQKDLNRRWEYLKRYGSNSLSFHTLQNGIQYFDIDPYGYIAYKDFGPFRFALSDPVCDDSDIASMVQRFDNEHGNITFFHITAKTANALNRLGYHVNESGEETLIDLATYSFSGRDKEDIRHLHNKANREGVLVHEIYGDRDVYEEAQKITGQWLQNKRTTSELWFITRQPVYDDFLCVRKFYGYLDGKIVAYVYFDPVWDGSEVLGYCPSILRCLPDAPKGVLPWIICEAMGKFKKEGVGKLFLGLMPLYNIEDDIHKLYNYSPETMMLMRWIYSSKLSNWFYGFKNLAFHKQRYRAEKRKVYMATRSRLPVMQLSFAAFMVGFFGGRFFFRPTR